MKDALARFAIPFVTLVATLILTACGGGHVSPTLSDNGIGQDAEIEQSQSEPVPNVTAVAAENKEIAELWYLAEQDDAEAQWTLGAKYAEGLGVPQDDAEAVKWFRKAAEQGHAKAQLCLGFMYSEGLGVPQDDAEAVKWLRRAAEQGLADVQFMVGGMYQRGEGVPQEDAEAVKWWRRAAEQGHAKAQYSLGGMYAKGLGVPQDNAEAMKWLRRAAEQGLAEAQFMVGFRVRHWSGRAAESCRGQKVVPLGRRAGA